MRNGITWNGLHSQLDFGATTKERKISFPPKDRITDRAPYSSVTEDFTELFGSASYGERTLKYKFVISDLNGMPYLEERVNRFISWLYSPVGKSALYDDRREGWHYLAVCTNVEPNYIGGVVAEIAVTFAADPFLQTNQFYLPSEELWPDVNMDGIVDASDAAAILAGAVDDGAGGKIPLTEAQKLRADANRDGRIDSSDAAIVLDYIVKCGAGLYANSPEGWAAYLTDAMGRETEFL